MTGIGKTPRDPTPDLTGRAGYPDHRCRVSRPTPLTGVSQASAAVEIRSSMTVSSVRIGTPVPPLGL